MLSEVYNLKESKTSNNQNMHTSFPIHSENVFNQHNRKGNLRKPYIIFNLLPYPSINKLKCW